MTTREYLDAIADAVMAADPTIRILKIQEEAGEAAEAWIGYLGANARKGEKTLDDVQAELADVAITAWIALRGLGLDPMAAIADRVLFLHARLEAEGLVRA